MLGTILLALSVLTAAGQRSLIIHDKKAMASQHVTFQEIVTNVCNCKAKCYVDLDCQAVETKEQDSESWCRYSTSVGVQTALSEANSSFVTYVKKGCGPGFELVDKICYFFSDIAADYETAKAACPLQSALAFPYTAEEMKILKEHLETYKSDTGKWYLDVKLASDNKWYWSNGVEVTDSTLVVNELEPCGKVEATSYVLLNTACSEALHYICQHAPQA